MSKCAYITRKPFFETINTLDEIKHVIYCIIRCKITNYDKRIFRPNKNNYYTGSDLQSAQEEGYTIELLIGGEPNYMYYPDNAYIPDGSVWSILQRFIPFKDVHAA